MSISQARWNEINEQNAAQARIAQDMLAAGVVPENDLDLEPVQLRLRATRHAWAGDFYHLHSICGRILDLRAQAAGYPDRWSHALAERRWRRTRLAEPPAGLVRNPPARRCEKK